MPDTFIKLPDPRIKERSTVPISAYFRDSADAADAPTTVHYRIDDLRTRTVIKDWTSVSAAASVSISVSPTDNRMINNRNQWEQRQITVAADKDLSTETRDTAMWWVKNIAGFED